MAIFIPCTFRCDHVEPGCAPCSTTAITNVQVVIKNHKDYEFKIRLTDYMPEGWITDKVVTFDSERIEVLCPLHGRMRQPWKY